MVKIIQNLGVCVLEIARKRKMERGQREMKRERERQREREKETERENVCVCIFHRESYFLHQMFLTISNRRVFSTI